MGRHMPKRFKSNRAKAVGRDSWMFLDDLGRRLVRITQDSRAAIFLLQRISSAVQRGNAACVLGTVADFYSDSFF